MADLEYVQVVGRFGIIVGDSADDPDKNPDTIWCDRGEIHFVPLLTSTKVDSATPVPVTLTHSTIIAQVNYEGYLSYNQDPFVNLVDLTSDVFNPHVAIGRATHRVEFHNLSASGIPMVVSNFTARFSYDGGPTTPLDLTLVAPVAVGSNIPVVRGPQGEPGPSTPAGVSFNRLTLSAGSPVVPELANVNEWVVTGIVQVQLPVVSDGSQFTVHVTSGFQNLTWPNGTTVYGETDQQDVWVTLIRGDAGWNVLIPSLAS